MFVRFTNKNTTSIKRSKKKIFFHFVCVFFSTTRYFILCLICTHDTCIHLCIELAHEKSYFTMAAMLPSQNCIISGQDHLELRLFLFYFFLSSYNFCFLVFLLLDCLGVWCLFHTANISIGYIDR